MMVTSPSPVSRTLSRPRSRVMSSRLIMLLLPSNALEAAARCYQPGSSGASARSHASVTIGFT